MESHECFAEAPVLLQSVKDELGERVHPQGAKGNITLFFLSLKLFLLSTSSTTVTPSPFQQSHECFAEAPVQQRVEDGVDHRVEPQQPEGGIEQHRVDARGTHCRHQGQHLERQPAQGEDEHQDEQRSCCSSVSPEVVGSPVLLLA